ncbi:MAG: hypothetical protein IKT68_01650 [Clostridia bacterium]|nr:hypothetical protein [Clostridia bacterium]
MKRRISALVTVLDMVHDYPMKVMIISVYLSILAFTVCGIVTWFPSVLSQPYLSINIGSRLFELGNALLCVGGITAPLMDLILHYDIDGSR